ncbi:MAG: hypothetical protein RIQ60_4507 [Pseudomonadota bacterium]|jgi:hypothetical protein
MNETLERLVRTLDLAAPDREDLSLAFGHACVARVQHLLEEPEVLTCLATLGAYVQGRIDRAQFDAAVAHAARLASQHPGSKSIDGCGHAAVSATYAVAKALAGQALQAAEYAAYAAVYGDGGYGAVAHRESFQPEFDWQCDCLARLAADFRRVPARS